MAVRFLSVGDRALTIEFGDVIDRGLSREVLRLDRAIRAAPPAGVVETVPTFRSLTVHYDPLATSRADLECAIAGLLGRARVPTPARGCGGSRCATPANSRPISPRSRA